MTTRPVMTNPGLMAKVAEGIMGWQLKGKRGSGMYWAPDKHRTQMLYGSELHLTRREMDIEHDKPGDGFCVWFDGNMSDAWQVVERMRNIQPVGHVGPAFLHGLRSCAPNWEATFCTDFGLITGPQCLSAAEAICFAAVRAMKLDEEIRPRTIKV